jgi:hypothetical protein
MEMQSPSRKTDLPDRSVFQPDRRAVGGPALGVRYPSDPLFDDSSDVEVFRSRPPPAPRRRGAASRNRTHFGKSLNNRPSIPASSWVR